jgi:DNA-binding transcriptional LysR family regulator
LRVALAQESTDEVKRVSRGEGGELNVGYSPDWNFQILPLTLQQFTGSCPHIHLRLLDLAPAQQLRALEDGSINLAFLGLRISGAPGKFKWERAGRQRIVAAIPSHCALAKQRRVRLAELNQMLFVAHFERTNPGFAEWFEEICRRAGFSPKVAQYMDSEAGQLAFVAAGFGVALVREEIERLDRPGVLFRPLVPDTVTDCCMTWNTSNDSKALQEYIRIVRQASQTQGLPLAVSSKALPATARQPMSPCGRDQHASTGATTATQPAASV